MQAYSKFASIYDKMMDNIPYADWKQYLLCLFYKNHIPAAAKIAELGCGTGTMTELLADDGFIMTGLDLSADMLKMAKKKQARAAKNSTYNASTPQDKPWPQAQPITYLKADMRDFDLKEKQDAIISICDCVNYLTSEEDLYKTFAAVRRNLKAGGIFIFDLKTEHFFLTQLDGQTFKESRRDYSCTWKNHFDKESGIHYYHLLIKTKEGGKWVSCNEFHQQKVFSGKSILYAAQKAGFTKALAYDAFSLDRPKNNSDRIYIVLSK